MKNTSQSVELMQNIAELLTEKLLPNWGCVTEEFGSLVYPLSASTQKELANALKDEAWRLAHAMCYEKFVSVEQTPTGGYLIYSVDDSEKWFQILVDIK
jgi:hypothetical protein